MPKAMERLGRVKISFPKTVQNDQGEWILVMGEPEPCVKVKYFTWGPGTSNRKPGKDGYVEWVEVFPIDQRNHRAGHPRHLAGYSEDNTFVRQSCVSPSCSFYSDLCKYGNFKFG